MEKLLEFIKTFIGQFIAVFQDYQEQAPISPEKRKERKAAIVTAGGFFRSNSVEFSLCFENLLERCSGCLS